MAKTQKLIMGGIFLIVIVSFLSSLADESITVPSTRADGLADGLDGQALRAQRYLKEDPIENTNAVIIKTPNKKVFSASSFQRHVIATDLQRYEGKAVCTADLNNDGKPDIILVDANKLVIYENIY